ncbi:MAG: B12-binding domain-containing radical SAM protein [Candidatus Cloacimonetes bacterium]|nr:B12-binding domain-containing radical SAM protein [Candidatus Cloacimonadota bacterium]
MKKLVLTTLNARYTHTSLALYYLQAVLQGQDIEVELCEYNINQPQLDIIEDLLSRQADYIAFSIYIWNVEQIKSILTDLGRLVESTRFIAGGPEVSYKAEKWLAEFECLDYVVTGAGEGVIAEIIADENGRLKGIVPGKAVSIAELPFPYEHLDIEGKDSRYFYYETSRGCPFRCAYCLSSRSDQKLQFRPIQLVYIELEQFIRGGYAHIKLVDRTFNAKPARSRQIWQKIAELYKAYPESETGFHFEIHPELLGEEDFAVLSAIPSGRFRFEIGIQTLNSETGKLIHRQMDWAKVKENILRIKELGNIHIHLDLIAGLPGEDIDSLAAGFDDVIKLDSGHLQLGFLKILAGTEMESLVSEHEIIYQVKAPYQVLQTKLMSWADLGKVRQVEAVLDIYYNSGRFKRAMTVLLTEKEISGWLLLRGLAGYYQQLGLDLRMRDWERCAIALVDMVMTLNIIGREELLDHLRIDWCGQSRSSYYPVFLQNEVLAKARKKGYQILSQHKNDIDGLKAAEIRQAIFFLPVSDYYKSSEIQVYFGKAGRKQIVTVT